jgi:hypothetical protein
MAQVLRHRCTTRTQSLLAGYSHRDDEHNQRDRGTVTCTVAQ